MDNINSTPVSSRLRISIFGRRNAGKSSLINALTNQPIALVSDVAGTTTDPVSKTMELLPIGPIVVTDTAGIDDEGMLGQMRVEKSYEVLNRTDLAILVIDNINGLTSVEKEMFDLVKSKNIPFVSVVNKMDQSIRDDDEYKQWETELGAKLVKVSALTRDGIEDLKRTIVLTAPYEDEELSLVSGLVNPGDFAVLVIPIDKAAPKGRLILPQQQVIRDLLDHDAMGIVTKEHELRETLDNLSKKPAVVITDSQAFLKVSADTPLNIPLTSFSILMARSKGDLTELVKGAKAIDSLQPGDHVLIAESCTHHRQSDDIGTVKIPRWLRQMVGGELNFEWFSGTGFPKDLKKYKLIVHCGGCMINRREMLYRIGVAKEQGIPIVNYGVLIAHVHGILQRAVAPFPSARAVLED